MNIPKKAYAELTDRHLCRRSSFYPMLISIAIALAIGGLYYAFESLKTPNRVVVPTKKRTTNIAQMTGIQDEGAPVETKSFYKDIIQAVERGDSAYIATAGMLIHINGSSEEHRKAAEILLKHAESLGNVHATEFLSSTQFTKNYDVAIVSQKSDADESKTASLRTPYYTETRFDPIDKKKANTLKLHEITRIEQSIAKEANKTSEKIESFENHLIKLREARIKTEEKTRREAEREKLRAESRNTLTAGKVKIIGKK